MSREGRDYKKTVCYSVLISTKKTFKDSDRLGIHIKAYPPDRRKRDLDNICKLVFDSLQTAGVFKNDEQFDSIFIERHYDIEKKGTLGIQIYTKE